MAQLKQKQHGPSSSYFQHSAFSLWFRNSIQQKGRSRYGKFLAFSFLLAAIAPACAQTLGSLFAQARMGEPTYLGVKVDVAAAKARSDQAVGAMLPQLSFSGNTNDNDRRYKTRNSYIPETHDNYDSSSLQLSLTQPIWRHANIVSLEQAKAVVEQSEHQLIGAEQELFAKLATAWFDLLAARDNVAFTAQQTIAVQQQLETIRRGEELGTHGQPEVEEAKAKLHQAMAEAITAETEMQLKQAALEQLVGTVPIQSLPYLHGNVEFVQFEGDGLATWLERIETSSPNILASMKAYEAATSEVSKQRAGHLPTLDLTMSYSKNSQQVGGFPGQAGYDIKQGAVGLQLNVPIFSGGTQSAKVDEALAQKDKAMLDVEAVRRQAVMSAKQAWYGWIAGKGHAAAGQQAMASAASMLATARRGRDHGLKSDFDVLQAEAQMLGAQRDFRKGRYEQLVSLIRLRALAGVLSDEDIAVLDRLLINEPNEREYTNVKTAVMEGRP